MESINFELKKTAEKQEWERYRSRNSKLIIIACVQSMPYGITYCIR